MLTKYSHRQNPCVDKILASTKCWHMHRSISLLFGLAESTAADFSQTSLMISYVSQKVLIPPDAVAKWLWACSALLTQAHSAPYHPAWSYRSAMLTVIPLAPMAARRGSRSGGGGRGTHTCPSPSQVKNGRRRTRCTSCCGNNPHPTTLSLLVSLSPFSMPLWDCAAEAVFCYPAENSHHLEA